MATNEAGPSARASLRDACSFPSTRSRVGYVGLLHEQNPTDSCRMDYFIPRERIAQSAYFAEHLPAGVVGHGGAAYRLLPEHKALNLAPCIRAEAIAYFKANRITWHQHANHALSSQINCLNFFMPLATRPELLASVLEEALNISKPKMIEVEKGPDGRPWFVGFEWIGRQDYLNEAGKSGNRSRGANVTSADAIVRFEAGGRVETLLIEWKYTESYGNPIPAKGNDVRLGRYRDLAFAPSGPVRADQNLAIADFFWEPFYQLLRQQMLAFQMQAAHEDGADRVRVLHISPASNHALHAVTAPALRSRGEDAFLVFRDLLVCPDDFVCRSTAAVFAKALAEAGDDARPWADYLLTRHSSLIHGQ